MNVRPLIAICGTTGVGKSDLAIELALHLSRTVMGGRWSGARIINADAMQVYQGLDIMTNKVPEPERHGIEHLLMGFKAPGEQYVVGEWVQDALKAIEETHQRNQIPIVVGGTAYWIQHLIFPNRLLVENPSAATQIAPMSRELVDSIASLPPHLRDLFNNPPEHPPSAASEPDAAFDLHTLLSTLDASVAARWHWRDTRKVLRSLSIIKESGRRASDIIKDQTNDASATIPRFRTLCFWLYAEPSVLNPRLDRRIDRMIEQGLLNEIRSLHDVAEAGCKPKTATTDSSVGPSTDYTLGIYQAIGYREFSDYVSNSTQQSQKVFADAVERMKISTRQYARRQISWIRNKLLPLIYTPDAKEHVPAYLLDATGSGEQWIERVRTPAIDIIEGFLEHRHLPEPVSLSATAKRMLDIDKKPVDPTSVLNARQKMICPICTTRPDRPVMVEEGQEWDAHQKTRVHRRSVGKQKQRKHSPSTGAEGDKSEGTESGPLLLRT